MNKTRIPWTDYTWNPVTGCTPVSEGCEHCYCRAMEKRFRWETAITLHPERLEEPRRLRKPAKIFVCSMSDLFHDDVPGRYINQVWNVMFNQPQHIFMILTKRPERLLRWTEVAARAKCWPIEDIWPDWMWLGVTAENQARADERIPVLLQVPAAIRFVSVEPMLEPVRFREADFSDNGHGAGWLRAGNAAGGPTIDWCIVGAESGPGARPMQLQWARDLRDQCVAAGVPFFLKQATIDGKLVHMPELDGQRWAQFPEVAHA